MLVNDQGNPISGKRAKRDVNKSGQKYFSLTAFGNKLHLNVTLNKNLIGPNFYVETKHKNGSRAFADTPHRNFYHGHVVSQPNSLVAISENRGVVSAFVL